MASYEYACHDCHIIVEKIYDFAKNPSKISCPECKKKIEQNWAGRDIPVHFKGAGWSQPTGHNQAGGSDEINQRLQDKSKERMASGWQQYAKYEPSEGYVKAAKARRLSGEEVKQGLDASKKLSSEMYNKAGINPHKKIKPQ